MISNRFSAVFVSGLSLILFAIGQLPAAATNHLNCQAYAQSVINQANENAKWGCGFTGGRWSTDYNFQVNWCNTVQMVDLTNEQKARNAQLQQCKLTKPGSGVRPANAYSEKECQNYAQQMIDNTKFGIARNCGINDSRMHLNYQAHFDWCFNGRTKKHVRATLNEIIASVKQCVVAQNTKTFWPSIGFTPDGKPKVQIAYNYCDRLFPKNRKCGKPVADRICKLFGFANSTAHEKVQLNGFEWLHTSYFIETKQGGKGTSQTFKTITCVK